MKGNKLKLLLVVGTAREIKVPIGYLEGKVCTACKSRYKIIFSYSEWIVPRFYMQQKKQWQLQSYYLSTQVAIFHLVSANQYWNGKYRSSYQILWL